MEFFAIVSVVISRQWFLSV